MNIRPLVPEDLQQYRRSRLTALREHPESFCSSHERESQFSDARFLERMAIAEGQMILGYFLNDELVGTLGIGRLENEAERHICFVWGMYVSAERGGQGIGRALLTEAFREVEAVDGVSQLNLSVIENNVRAMKLYEALGFESYGHESNALVVNGKSYGEIFMRKSFD